jgi:hypothetical protein
LKAIASNIHHLSFFTSKDQEEEIELPGHFNQSPERALLSLSFE